MENSDLNAVRSACETEGLLFKMHNIHTGELTNKYDSYIFPIFPVGCNAIKETESSGESGHFAVAHN